MRDAYFSAKTWVLCVLLACLAMRGGAQAQRFFVLDDVDDEVYRYTEAVAANGNWDTNASGNAAPSDIYVDDTYVYTFDDTDKTLYRYSFAGGGALPSRASFGPAGAVSSGQSAVSRSTGTNCGWLMTGRGGSDCTP